MSFGLPPEFFAQLGYYVVLAGHIEHTLHEMLPEWQSGLLDQKEIGARKNRGTLLKMVSQAADKLPEDLGKDLRAFCDLLDERSRYRHRAVHGAWFAAGGGLRNLYFEKDGAGHWRPEPMEISQEEVNEAIIDIEQLLETAHALRDRIRAYRQTPPKQTPHASD